MNLLLIGCGNIGSALLNQWAPLKIVHKIVIVQPTMAYASYFSNNNSIKFVNNINDIAQDFNEYFTILAIKPQNINKIVPDLKQRSHKSIIISMIAGIQIARLSTLLPDHSKIIRIMPNIAIKTGKSINLSFPLYNLNSQEIDNIEKLFTPLGNITWMQEEKHIDLLTPISGSGPAYFFSLAEDLVTETIKLGIDENMAREIIQKLFIGSASLIENNTNYEEIIKSIASKKGVTEKALEVIRPNIKHIMTEAIKVALIRLKELSNEDSG